MFKKLGLGRSKGGSKIKFEVQVVSLDNLPTAVKRCRVQWARSNKVQQTEVKEVRNGIANFRQTLVSYATVAKGDTKEYTLRVQVPGKSGGTDFLTVGKANIDMARYVTADGHNMQNAMIPISFKVGASSTGYLKLQITTSPAGADAPSEDAMSTVSGMSTSQRSAAPDQDLDGFDDRKGSRLAPSKSRGRTTHAESDEEGSSDPPKPMAKSASKARPASSSRRATREESESESEGEIKPVSSGKKGLTGLQQQRGGRTAPQAKDTDDEDAAQSSGSEAAPAARKGAAGASTSRAAAPAADDPFSKRKGGPAPSPSAKKPPPKSGGLFDDDEDISPMESELEDEGPAMPKAKAATGAARAAMYAAGAFDKDKKKESKIEIDIHDPKKTLISAKKGIMGKLGIKDSAEEAARKAEEEAAAATAKAKAEKLAAAKAAEPQLDDMKASLFGKKTAAGAAGEKSGAGKGGAAGPSSSKAAPKQEDEDEMRNALFATSKPKAAAAPAAAAAKAGKAKTPEPLASDDEDAARAALFSSKPAAKGKAKTPEPEPLASDDEDAARAALFSSKPAAKPKAKAPEPPPAASDDEDAARAALFGSSKPSGKPSSKPAAAKPPPSEPSEEEDLFGDSIFAKKKGGGSSKAAPAPAASSKAKASSSKAPRASSDAESDELAPPPKAGKAAAASAAAAVGAAAGAAAVKGSGDLQQQLREALQRAEAAERKVKDLEAHLDEDLDMADLYHQMQEMETKHRKELQETKLRYEQEIEELKEQLEEAGSGAGAAAGPRAGRDELARMEAELEARAEELAEMEEQLKKQLADAKARASEADKRIDESLGMAVKAKEEKKTLMDEIEKLKAQLADASAADTRRMARGSFSGSEGELREELDRLQRENDELQRMCEEARAGASALQADVQELLRDAVRKGSVELPKSGAGLLGPLPGAVAALCTQYGRQAVELDRSKHRVEVLEAAAATTTAAAATAVAVGNIRPHELHGRVQELTQECEQLTERVAGLQQQLKDAQQRAQQVAEENTQLKHKVSEAEYELKQARQAAEANRLLAENSESQLVAVLASPRSIGSSAAAAAGGALTGAAVVGAAAAASDGRPRRSREHEAAGGDVATGPGTQEELDSLRTEVSQLRIHVAELRDADAIIKEWSDYADTLAADKEQLQRRVEELERKGGAEDASRWLPAGAGAAAGAMAASAAGEGRVTELEHQLRAAADEAAALRRENVELAGRADGLQGSAAELTAVKAELAAVTALLQAQLASAQQAEARLRAENQELRAAAEEAELGIAPRAASRAAVPVAAAGAAGARSLQGTLSSRRRRGSYGSYESSGSSDDGVGSDGLPRSRSSSEGRLSSSGSLDEHEAELGSDGLPRSRRSSSSSGAGRRRRTDISEQPDEAATLRVEVRTLQAELARTQAELARAQQLQRSGASALPAGAGDDDDSGGEYGSPLRARSRSAGPRPAAFNPLYAPEDLGLDSGDSGDEGAGGLGAASQRVWSMRVERLQQLVAALQAKLDAQQVVVAACLAGDSDSDGGHTPPDPLALRLSQLAEENADLKAQLGSARLDAERAPLVGPSAAAGEATLAAAPRGVPAREPGTGGGSASAEELRAKVSMLSSWKATAEATLLQVQAAQQSLQLDRDEAVREVAQLHQKLQQLDGGQAGGAEAKARVSAAKPPKPRAPLPAWEGAATAAAVVHVTRQALASCRRVVVLENADASPGPSEDDDLEPSMLYMKDEALALFSELQRQAKAGPRFESQLQMAAQRCEELEAAVSELQEGLARARQQQGHGGSVGAGLSTLAEAGGFGSPRATMQHASSLYGQAPDSPSSASAAAAAAAATGVALGHHSSFSYGDDTSLATAALEQQLTLAERRWEEEHHALERALADKAKLEQQLDEATSSGKGKAGSRSRARGRGLSDSDSEGGSAFGAKAKGAKGGADAGAQATIAELRAKVEKLEGVCSDMEHRAEQERHELESKLDEAEQEIETLHKQLEDLAAGPGGAAPGAELARLQSALTAADTARRRLERERSDLMAQLEEEREAREGLEDQLRTRLEDMGDDEAADAVAAFEAKYQRLKDRYKMLEESSQEEIDALAEQLAEAQGHAAELQGTVSELQRKAASGAAAPGGASSRAGPVSAPVGGAGASSRELEELRRENEGLVTQLVQKQMELAEVQESVVMLKRELYKARTPGAHAPSGGPQSSDVGSTASTPKSQPPKKKLFGRG